jgi:hypothetical protein
MHSNNDDAKKNIKSIFWNADETFEDTDKFNWTQYLINVKKFLKIAISSDGKLDVEYKFAKNQSSGRLYAINGMQSMQSNMRNYVSGEYYNDFDVINCHPSILLHICNTMNIQSTYLKQYVTDRANTLASNDLNKIDILIAINTDDNKQKRSNNWYNGFLFELVTIKAEILKNITIVTTNDKNPDSSKINKYMCQIENEILTIASAYFGDCSKVLMFDGIMADKTKSSPDDIDELNKTFKLTYNGLIKWSIKSTDSDVVLDDDFEAPMEYEVQKVILKKRTSCQDYHMHFGFRQMTRSMLDNGTK